MRQAGNLGTFFLLREVWSAIEGIRRRRSPLVQGAWAGRLVHFSGLDVLGPTAGAIARLLQDREIELWEGKRIVASLRDDPKLVRTDFSPSPTSFTETCTRRRTAPISPSLTHPSALSAPLRALRHSATGSLPSTRICSCPCQRNRWVAPKRPRSSSVPDALPPTWMRC